MRKGFNRAFWWVGLKLLPLVGCFLLFSGAAEAKGKREGICKAGWKYRMVRDKDGSSMAGCTDGKTFDGYVQMRDARARLTMAGEFHGGEMDGVWKVYDLKGRVVKRALFERGKVVNDDYVPPEEMEGVPAGWEGKDD